MKTYGINVARHDRGSLHRFTSSFSRKPWVTAWQSLSNWFRSMELVIGQAGLDAAARLSPRPLRNQPIPVVAFPMYPAPRPLSPRGHVRI